MEPHEREQFETFCRADQVLTQLLAQKKSDRIYYRLLLFFSAISFATRLGLQAALFGSIQNATQPLAESITNILLSILFVCCFEERRWGRSLRDVYSTQWSPTYERAAAKLSRDVLRTTRAWSACYSYLTDNKRGGSEVNLRLLLSKVMSTFE